MKKICENPKCKKLYSPRGFGQKYCCAKCRLNDKKKFKSEVEILKYKCVICGALATSLFNRKPYCNEHYFEKRNKRGGRHRLLMGLKNQNE